MCTNRGRCVSAILSSSCDDELWVEMMNYFSARLLSLVGASQKNPPVFDKVTYRAHLVHLRGNWVHRVYLSGGQPIFPHPRARHQSCLLRSLLTSRPSSRGIAAAASDGNVCFDWFSRRKICARIKNSPSISYRLDLPEKYGEIISANISEIITETHRSVRTVRVIGSWVGLRVSFKTFIFKFIFRFKARNCLYWCEWNSVGRVCAFTSNSLF